VICADSSDFADEFNGLSRLYDYQPLDLSRTILATDQDTLYDQVVDSSRIMVH